MPAEKLQIAIVGLGFGAEFIPIYQDHPNVESITICDAHPPRLEAIGNRYGIARRCTQLAEVLESPEIDAVHLVTGIPDHAPQALDVLNSGKHCACTVPMGTSLDQLREIVSAEHSSGKNYMMMETAVYTRPFLFARTLHERGEFGRLQFLRGATYADMETWPTYWAGLPPMWYATHAIAPLLSLAGTRARKVYCLGSGRMRNELTRQYGNQYPIETAIFELDSPGLSAEITMSLFHCGRPYMESFVFYGENACYEWQMENEPPVLFRRSALTDSNAIGKANREHAPSTIPGRERTLTIERPQPPDRADLLPPEIRRHTSGVHHGSHPHLVHEFISSIIERRKSAVDAVTAANWCAAGICAHDSAMAGGREIDVPQFS